MFQTSSGDIDPDAVFEGHAQLDRELLVHEVLQRNPTLRAARSALEAARSSPAQARSLLDPILSYSLAPQSVGSDAARYGQVLRFSQPLPYPGKRRLRGEIAEAEAAAADHEVAALQLRLATLASLLFDDYYVVERAIEINEEHVELLDMFQQIASARYAAGEAPQQAPLQAEVEVAHLIHRRVLLQTDRAVLVTRLNALLHRKPTASLPPPPKALTEDVWEEPGDGDRLECALATRPEVHAARSRLEASRLEVELSQLALRPDFELMGSFDSMWNTSQHRFMIGAGLSLPLYRGRLRAAIAEAEARAAAVESELEALADQVWAEVTAAELRLGEAKHVVSLYESRLVPAAADQVAAALTGFRTGQSSFLALIDAERSQRTVRLDLHRALTDVHRRRAELDQALGRLPGSLARKAAAGTHDRAREGDQP